MSVGRISGPLLKANLLRDGIDLAFENDLLYLDVNNLRVGINTSTPTHDLHVDGTTRTSYLETTNQLDIGNITITGNTISSNVPILNLTPASDGVVYQNKLTVDQIDIQDNKISTNTTNADLEIRITGTGSLKIFSDLLVDGNIHATGNITADGDITIGDSDTDNVIINADIGSNLIPNVTDTFDIGSVTNRWNSVWTNNFVATNVYAQNVIVDGVNVATEQGNIYYVSANGDDTNDGRHQNDPLATIEHALTFTTAGDTVFIYPGVYQENFPLVVPTGVTIKGIDIRNVIIEPTTSGTASDAFHLNGETTIEDLTVRNFYYDSLNNTGYAFRFADNIKVTTRSPYVRNVTVITQGSITSTLDPRGFDQGDAGRGVYLDGFVIDSTSKEASCLFSNVTFITPGVDSIVLTNGIRAEFTNCFTYFANRGIYAYVSPQGRFGHQHTILKINPVGVVGTYNPGETISYYDESNTLLASGVIEFIQDGKLYLTGYCPGFEEFSTRLSKVATAYGNAQLSNTQTKFGSTSLALDGTGDYVYSPSNIDYYFNLQDFTIEGWFYRTTSGNTTQYLFDFRTQDTTNAPCLYWNGGNLYYFVNGTSIITGAGLASTDTWYHVAISRNGSNTKLFVDGVQVGSTWTDNTNYVQSPFYLGSKYNQAANEFFCGFVDYVRISKGISRYNSNFPLPIAPDRMDSYTVLFLSFDGVNGSTTIEDNTAFNQDIQFSGGATASYFDLADYHDFGAEVRIIGSANVYGNYGIVGDGPGVIMTIISHNVAYVGSGKNQENDSLLTIHANEIVELNNAKLYYTTINEQGDFRVGDLFFVNQLTGEVEFTNSIVNIVGPNGITLTDGANTTILQPTKIETGNLRISGNTIESLLGEVNLNAANDQINLQNNVNISGNLNVTGDVAIGGNITIGDNTTDSVTFVAGINSNLIPRIGATYNIGAPNLQWKDLFVRVAHISDIEINTNYIRTTVSNANLELRANGTGAVSIERVDVNENIISTNGIDNLIINPATTLDIYASTTNVNGTLHVTNNVDIDGNIVLGESPSDNVVFNSRVNSNIIPTVTGIFDLGSSTNTWAIAHLSSSYIDDIYIDTNIITTITSNANLELKANGTGAVRIEQIDVNENVILTNSTTNLELRPATTLDIYASTTNVNGTLHVTNDVKIDGNIVLGDSTFDNVAFIAKVNSDIIPTASGIFDLGSSTNAWAVSYLANAYIDDINIDTNIIQTTVSNSNLELKANGTGAVRIEQIDVNENVILTNGTTNLELRPATTLDIYASTTNVNGDLHVTNNVSIDGNIILGDSTFDNVTFNAKVNSNIIPTITGTFDLGSSTNAWAVSYLASAYIDDIYIDTNIIQTTVSNSNLELRANGTGAVRIEQIDVNENVILTNGTTNLELRPATTLDIYASTTNVNGDFHVTNNVSIDGNITLGNLPSDNVTFNAKVDSDIVPTISGVYNLGSTTNAWAVSYLASAYIDDIYIDTNIITTTASNSNLELRANGTGAVRIEQIDVNENVILTNGTTNLELRPATTLDIFADTNITGNLSVTGNVTIGGNITVGNQDTDNITFASDINSSLLPNIPVTYDLGSFAKRWRTVYSEKAFVSDIEINTNYIRTTISNADLELRANGTGGIKLEDLTVNQNIISASSGTNIVVEPSGTGIVDINSTQAIRIPRGTTAERPGTPLAGMIRYNTTNNNYEGFDGTYWRVINGLYDVDQNTYLVAEATPGSNNNTFYFVADGSQIADLTASRLNAVRVEVDDIFIDGNTIGSINNQSIDITAAGTGNVIIEDFSFKNNVITNTVTNGVTELIHIGTGYFKIDGTTGFRVPVGNAVQRPNVTGNPTAFIGFTRYNTDDNRLEIFDGVTWNSAAGSTAGITVAQAEDQAILTVLTLG